MGMSMGDSKDGAKPNINVTPLIDVLLVLIIIFMLITPLKPSRFEAKIPAEPKDEQNAPVKPNPLTLVVTIDKSGALLLNKDSMGNVGDTSTLTDKLIATFKERAIAGTALVGNTNEVERTIFVKAPRSLKYGEVVKVIDAVKIAQAQPIGLQIDDLTD